MKALSKKALAATVVVMLGWTPAAHAEDDHAFTLICPNGSQIVEWEVEDGDPGRAFLLYATNEQYPQCIVLDYEDEDEDLPHYRYNSDQTAIATIALYRQYLRTLFAG